MVAVFGWNIDFGDGASNRPAGRHGFYTAPADGARLVTGLTSELGEGFWRLSSTPDTDTGPALVSVPVPPTTPTAAGTAVRPIGATSSMDALLASDTAKAISPSGLSGSSIAAVPAKLPSSPSIPMLVQVPVQTIGATTTRPSYVEPLASYDPVKAISPSAVSAVPAKSQNSVSTIHGAGASPTFGTPTIGKGGVQNGAVDVDVQPVQPVQRAPTPARPITGAAPSALVGPVVPAVSLVSSVNVGRLVYLGLGGAALEAASNADKARLKQTTNFLSGDHVHILYRDANGTTKLLRNATTFPRSPSGNVEWYPLTEVIQTDGGGLVPEAKTTLVFGRPRASASDTVILAKLGQAGYSHVLDALGADFESRSMWSVVGSNMWWACKKGPTTVVLSAPPGSALVSTHPRAYKEPSAVSCSVFEPADAPVATTVTTVTTVTAPTQVKPVAQPAAPPIMLSPADLAAMKASAQQPVQLPAQVQPAAPPAAPPIPLSQMNQPAQVQPAPPAGGVQPVVALAAPPSVQPVQQVQPAQQQQPASQQQPAQQPPAQLATESSLGCSELVDCLASASGGDILACGNALRAFGVCAGAAGAAGAAGDAASWLRYSSGSLVPLHKLASRGALYGSDVERAYTVVPDAASPSRGKVLVSSLSSPSSPSSVYPCELSRTVWAVVPVLPVPTEPRLDDTTAVQVHYTRTDTSAPTTKAPDLTVLWVVLGALGFALCLVALYAASRPRGLAGARGQ